MPGKSKRPAPEPEPAPPRAEEEDEEDEEGEEFEEGEEGEDADVSSDVEISYDFNQMQSGDMKEVMELLDLFVPGDPNPDLVEQLAGLCLKSPLTTTLKVAEEDDSVPAEVHGLISIVPLQPNMAVLKPLLDLVALYDDEGRFARAFQEQQCGLLVSERVVTLPQVAAQLVCNLAEELGTAPATPPLDCLLVLARVSVDADAEPAAEAPEKKRKRKAKARPARPYGLDPAALDESRFARVEDFYFWKHRVQEAPFAAFPHPNTFIIPKDAAPNFVPDKEVSVPILLQLRDLPKVIAEVKLLDAYYQTAEGADA
eukprot:TRINITY_DN4874_c0_g1_i1.p1 TRINITY_DN4874_c0_g1~~TRINITY_DN4874_c0_g1_i1.p1  ORF type:complete len:332 (-),score=134.44 TRINITY_DN4874_c0_g1_i1:72-1010(-)